MARWSDDIPKYWKLLEADMCKTGEFDLSRLKHALLRQTHYARRSIVRPETHNFVPRSRIWAHVARLKTKDPRWQELAWFYVAKEFEGNGYLTELAIKLVAESPPGIEFCGFTKRTSVMRVFGRLGLKPVTAATHDVEAWVQQVGILRKRIPNTTFRTSSPDPKEGERWLFVKW